MTRRRKTKFDTAVTIKIDRSLLDEVYKTAYAIDMDGSEFMRRAFGEAVLRYKQAKAEADVETSELTDYMPPDVAEAVVKGIDKARELC